LVHEKIFLANNALEIAAIYGIWKKVKYYITNILKRTSN